MKAKKKQSMIDIYSGTPWEAEQISQMLQASHLNASVNDDISGIVSSTSFLNIGNFAMKVFVPQEHYTDAMRIMSGHMEN